MEFEYKILNRINSPADVKGISRVDLCKLAEEMRHALIQSQCLWWPSWFKSWHSGNYHSDALCV